MNIKNDGCRLVHFAIKCADGTHQTTELYANGRHQCELVIEVIKEIKDDKGTWVHSPLTDQERDSITVVSTSCNNRLPLGWNCDAVRNDYDLGLWRTGGVQAVEMPAVVADSRIEYVRRYMRCETIQAETFIAQMVVLEQMYISSTFNVRRGVGASVNIAPVRPFQLDVHELDEFKDIEAFNQYMVDVDVYYWVPPNGLRFVENKGFEEPLALPNEGAFFSSSMARPLSAELSSLVGTLVDKNTVGQLLSIDEIYNGLELPPTYPPVAFNKRPTIMRVVRLLAKMNPPERDTKSAWRLLDNFGNEHKFLVGWSTDSDMETHVVLKNAVARRRRAGHLVIKLPSDQVSTNALYANGRHQCKVQVELIIERETLGGLWEATTPLEAERESVSVTRYSSNVNEPLPGGWSCDHGKNIYDTGLWRGNAELQPSTEPDVETGLTMDLIDRYLRFSPGVPIETVRFMARVVVDGVAYTTSYVLGGSAHDSSISVTPVRPYILKAADMAEYVDYDAFIGETADVDIYYWTPPSGLTFVADRGLDAPLFIPSEGRQCMTSFIKNASWSGNKIGVIRLSRQVLYLSDVHQGLQSPGYDSVVRFNQVSTIMRAVRLKSFLVQGNGDSRSKWRLWDNYGCEHVFWLEAFNNGNKIRLKEG